MRQAIAPRLAISTLSNMFEDSEASTVPRRLMLAARNSCGTGFSEPRGQGSRRTDASPGARSSRRCCGARGSSREGDLPLRVVPDHYLDRRGVVRVAGIV